MKTKLAAGACGVCALLAGCGSSKQLPPAPVADPGAPAHASPQAHGVNSQLRIIDVTIGRHGVSPRVVSMRPGARVLWTNRDSRVHTVTSDRGSAQRFSSGPLPPGGHYVISTDVRGISGYRSTARGDGRAFRGVVEAG